MYFACISFVYEYLIFIKNIENIYILKATRDRNAPATEILYHPAWLRLTLLAPLLLDRPLDSWGTTIELGGALIELGADDGDDAGIDIAVPEPLWPPGETGDNMPEPACPNDCDIGYEGDGADEAALMKDELAGGETLIIEDGRE